MIFFELFIRYLLRIYSTFNLKHLQWVYKYQMHYTPIWNRLIRTNILLCWTYSAQLSYTRNSIEKWQLIDLILAGNPGCSLKYYVSKINRSMTNEVGLYTLSSTRDIKNKNDSIFCGFALTLTYPWPDKKYQEFFLLYFRNFGVIHRLDVLMGCLSLFFTATDDIWLLRILWWMLTNFPSKDFYL